MDLQDVGDLTTAARETAQRVHRIIGVGIDSDILYLASEVREWVTAYQAGGAPAEYREIASLYGHDAFLIEWDQVERILRG
jgi:homoserine O-acetyltransferase